MALPRPIIQASLPGLLSLLGIKNGGNNPPHFGDQVQPTFDLESWYLRERRESNSLALALPAGAVSTDVVTVPSGEWWYVERFTVSATVVAGCTLNALVGRALVSTGGFAVTSSIDPRAGAFGAFASELRPFWLGPQQKLNIYSDATVPGASQLQGQYLFTRIQV